jgi:uncharacterized protein (TIGR02145 family)
MEAYMRNKFSKIVLAATLGLALAFTFSCSSDDGDGSGSSSLKYEGKTYKTVKIGRKIWMAENLNYNLAGSCPDPDDLSNCDKYGRLYNWETAKTVCPSGWHLPTDADWTELTDFVSPDAGMKLKAKSGWKDYNGRSGNGTDEFGFSALPGPNGDYISWWSAWESTNGRAWYRSMQSSSDDVTKEVTARTSGLYVRCVQD